jgi:hypothetical protein
MKKTILLLSVFLCALSLFALDPVVKFYPKDGSQTKEYKIDDIKDISLKNKSDNLLMKIYYNGSQNDVYPVTAFNRIEFGIDSVKARFLTAYIFNNPKTYALKNIDSVIFYYLETQIESNVVVIDSLKSIDLKSTDSTELVFSSGSKTAQNLKSGQIIAGEASKNAPNGFLKRINSVSLIGDNIVISTENISLTDVIQNCVISFEQSFTPSDTGKPYIKLTGNAFQADEGFTIGFKDIEIVPGIKVDGANTFYPSYGFSLVIENQTIKQVLFQLNVKNDLELTAKSNVEYEKEIKKSLNDLLGIPNIKLPSITVVVGWLPIVITSEIDLQVGIKLTIGAEVTTGITNSSSALCGFEYNNGNYKIFGNRQNSFNFSPPELSLGGSIKTFVGPQLNVNLYGQKEAFNVYANVLGFAELEVDLLNKPLWILWGGLEGNAGIESEWFGLSKELPLVLEYREKLAESNDLISSVTPKEGKVGDIIIIKGKGFGNVQGGSYVKFKFGKSLLPIDAYRATVYPKWTDGDIQVVIPDGLSAGNVKLLLNVGGFLSNMTDFKIIETPNPQISNINPSSAKVGDVISIAGSNFNSSQGTSFVSFNGTNATNYQSWSSTEIKVSVPQGATSGNVSVFVNGIKSNDYNFTVLSSNPTITTITPSTANIGDVVTINGSNFGSSQGTSFVTINGTNASEYTSWSDTQINVKVPTGAKTGKVSVTVNGTKSNEQDIVINTTPKIITIYTSKDAYIDNCRSDDNYNNLYLQLGRYLGTLTGCINEPSDRNIPLYFSFDNSINPDDIIEAKLMLTKKSGTSTLATLNFHLFKSNWVENAINFNWVFDNGNTNFTPFGTINNVSGDINFPMTQTVKNWIANSNTNFGFLLLYDGPVGTYLGNEFYDRENGNTYQSPRLVITLK